MKNKNVKMKEWILDCTYTLDKNYDILTGYNLDIEKEIIELFKDELKEEE
ncbi:hypothetical protein M0R19_08085 [Candidatus Pacearchaeota archaeon]|jgi:hypothetical protein|nr:hypothetical protein [Candidatus Pacearchaeota archaeon]